MTIFAGCLLLGRRGHVGEQAALTVVLYFGDGQRLTWHYRTALLAADPRLGTFASQKPAAGYVSVGVMGADPLSMPPASATPVTEGELDSVVVRILNGLPAAGLAVGVIRGGALTWFHGYGVADIESGAPVDEDTVFRIASVTKTMTAIAVMQLCEQGLVDLDAPASDYLRAYRLIPAKASFRPGPRRCGTC